MLQSTVSENEVSKRKREIMENNASEKIDLKIESFLPANYEASKKLNS